MAKSGMNPKTLQYLMGHSEIGVTLNTYTHLGLEDATDELKRMEDLENARKELDKTSGRKTVTQKMFRVVLLINAAQTALRLLSLSAVFLRFFVIFCRYCELI